MRLLTLFTALVLVTNLAAQQEDEYVRLSKIAFARLNGSCKNLMRNKALRFNPLQLSAIKQFCNRFKSVGRDQIERLTQLSTDLNQLVERYNTLTSNYNSTLQELQKVKLANNMCMTRLEEAQTTVSLLTKNYEQLVVAFQALRQTVEDLVNLLVQQKKEACSAELQIILEQLAKYLGGGSGNNDSNQQNSCSNGDVNGDGKVDDADLLIVLFNLGTGSGS